MEGTEKIIWQPDSSYLEKSYATHLMRKLGAPTVDALWKMSVSDIGAFWNAVMTDMKIDWYRPYEKVLDGTQGIEWTRWFVGGETNLALNCVDRWAKRTPDKTALIWEGDDGSSRNLSYKEFEEEVCRAANALRALGIKRGDTVGILMPMVPEVVIALFACFKTGAVAIPIFSGFGVEAIATRLSDAKAKVLFTSDITLRRGKRVEVKKTADEASKLAGCVSKKIVFKRGDGKVPWDPNHDLWWEEFVGSQKTGAETEKLPSEAECLIIFTSGTTGKPKGAIHTHAGCLAQVGKEHRYAFNTDENSRFFWFTDIGWMMGPWEMIGVTLFGGTLFLYEGAPDYPDLDRIWQMIDRYELTVLGISPTAIRLLMKGGTDPAKRHPMPSLRLLGSTGEPWDPESYNWYFENVGKKRCPVINISGGTEIIGCLLSPLPVQPLKACSLGGPALGVDTDVFDESGKPVRGGIGHLVCKQAIPSMTKGFLGSKQRYLDTYFSKWKGVWYHGDWARVDADGYWFLHGRSDDTIKIAGKRIGPVEFEAALMKNRRVSEAAAIGVPDELKGENCVCFVVLKTGEKSSPEILTELKNDVVRALGKSMAPKGIFISTALPKTRSAKILRGLIKKVYLGETIVDTSSVENPEALTAIKNACNETSS